MDPVVPGLEQFLGAHRRRCISFFLGFKGGYYEKINRLPLPDQDYAEEKYPGDDSRLDSPAAADQLEFDIHRARKGCIFDVKTTKEMLDNIGLIRKEHGWL